MSEERKQARGDAVKGVVLAALFLVCVGLTFAFHRRLGKEILFTHLFYFPIILAALWYQFRGVMVAVVLAATLLVSHLFFLPTNALLNDIARGCAFLAVATAVAYLSREIRTRTARLEISEANYRALIESSLDLVFELDPDLCFRYVNPVFLKATGYAEGELSGRWFAEMVMPAERAQVEKQLSETLRGRSVAPCEISLVGKTGELIAVAFLIKTVYGASGLASGCLGIGWDITERQRHEKERREHFRFLETLMDTIPSPVYYKDRYGRYAGCNRAFEAFLGLAKRDIIGKTVYGIAPEEVAGDYHERDEALFAHPGTQTYAGLLARQDGELRSVIFKKATLTDANGQVTGLIGVIVDIAELGRYAREVMPAQEAELLAPRLHVIREEARADAARRVAGAEGEGPGEHQD